MLAQVYSQKEIVDTLVIGHFDAHGSLTTSAVLARLKKEGLSAKAYVEFPVTGPQGFGDVLKIFDRVAPQRIVIIDIPVNVNAPQQFMDTLTKIAQIAPIYYYDHHETDIAFLTQLHSAGIYASVFSTAVDLAISLKLLNEEPEKSLAIIGIIADRDKSILRIVDKGEIESKWLRLANIADVVVRNPKAYGFESLSNFVEALSEKGISLIENMSIQYPPETLARQLTGNIIEQGTVSILVDWSNMPQEVSQWVPKTLEQLALMTHRDIIIAVVPGVNPRTRQIEGYDVRVLKYWLSTNDINVEKIVIDVLRPAPGRVVGHGDYVSVRYQSVEEARRNAEMLFRAIEGYESKISHLIEESRVAEAVKHDYRKIIELLEKIANALERGATAKERQVELLERSIEQGRRDLVQRD